MCFVGGPSSYSGHTGVLGGTCDYVVSSQLKNPCVNIYQWGKAQPAKQFHIQEVTTTTACDGYGTYLIGGTMKGNCYCWEIATGKLVTVWTAHHSRITKMTLTACGGYLITGSEDGRVSVWDMLSVVDASTSLYSNATSLGSSSGSKRHIEPFRTWCPHTLPVTDFTCIPVAQSYSSSVFRIASVSLDQSVVLYDVFAGTVVLKTGLGVALESVCMNHTEDYLFVGGANGSIYALNMSILALGLLQATNANIIPVSGGEASSSSETAEESTGSKGVSYVLSGHSKAVTCLKFSLATSCGSGNTSSMLVSGALDGTVCVWDIWNRKCVRVIKPFIVTSVGGSETVERPITNVHCCLLPEYVRQSNAGSSGSSGGVIGGTANIKPFLTPFQPLKKYFASQMNQGPVGGGSENSEANLLQLDPYSLPPQLLGERVDFELIDDSTAASLALHAATQDCGDSSATVTSSQSGTRKRSSAGLSADSIQMFE